MMDFIKRLFGSKEAEKREEYTVRTPARNYAHLYELEDRAVLLAELRCPNSMPKEELERLEIKYNEITGTFSNMGNIREGEVRFTKKST